MIRYIESKPYTYPMPVPDTKLRNAKPQDKNYRIQIGGNTYLEVLTTGKKVWRMRYYHPTNKKPAIYTLGEYPDLSQPRARNEAEAAKKLVKQGLDPTAYRKQERERLERERQTELRAQANSFESIARAWHKHRNETLQKWKPSHAEKIMNLLEANVFPAIGGVHVEEITAPMLLDAVQAIIDRGAIETAKKVNRYLNAVLRYAVVRKLIKHNEADNLRDEIPTVTSRHNPHLNADELPVFIRAVETDTSMGEVVKVGILFTLLTLARTNETRFARWTEFDMGARLWTIPAERMKMRKAHIVPLSNQVVALLERLHQFTGRYDYLFVTCSNNRPMSENAMLYALYRLGYRGKLTIHGLRGTGSTLLNETGFRGEVIEMALAHREKNAIRGAYNHAQYLEERRQMLQWYADHLDALKVGAQVIPIHRKRA